MAADIHREKLQLIEWILKQEKMAMLKPLHDAIAAMDRDTDDAGRVVGYRARGLRVTRKQLVDSIRMALDELDEVPLITLESLEQDSDKW
ncbi:MAG: hypothetical protein ACKVOR_05305 [Flavobacteriales bacterium]